MGDRAGVESRGVRNPLQSSTITCRRRSCARRRSDRWRGRIARAGGARAVNIDRTSRKALDELRDRQRALRPRAEEAVESELSAVLEDEGFGWRGLLLFPR